MSLRVDDEPVEHRQHHMVSRPVLVVQQLAEAFGRRVAGIGKFF